MRSIGSNQLMFIPYRATLQTYYPFVRYKQTKTCEMRLVHSIWLWLWTPNHHTEILKGETGHLSLISLGNPISMEQFLSHPFEAMIPMLDRCFVCIFWRALMSFSLWIDWLSIAVYYSIVCYLVRYPSAVQPEWQSWWWSYWLLGRSEINLNV